MLKKRIIATLIIKNNIVVQSIGFKKYLPIGNINIAVESLNEWGVDEIIVLDIDASKQERLIDLSIVKNLSKYSLVPICIGGGISCIEDIKSLLDSGADKICINQQFLENDSFIEEASKIFGIQCIIISLDIIKINKEYFVYNYITNNYTFTMREAILKAHKIGAGEIFINSVDNDGKKCGYDINMIIQACSISTIPIIAQGGAKNAYDIQKALEIKELAAVSASNMFHFTEHSITMTKSLLKKDKNAPIRLETNMKYCNSSFDKFGRLNKKTDEELEKQIFQIHKEEII